MPDVARLPDRPNLGQGLLTLCHAWRARVALSHRCSCGALPSYEPGVSFASGIHTLPLRYELDADAFARRVLALAEDGEHIGPIIAAVSGDASSGGAVSEALATFAAAVDASIALDADAFEVALQSAFRTLVHKLRELPFSPSSQRGTPPKDKGSEP